jgi:hypothetical protein
MSIQQERLVSSDIGLAKCINCGKVWGEHLGTRCPSEPSSVHLESMMHLPGSKSGFQPLGFALSDRCLNCGDTLVNHRDRAWCNSSSGNKKSFFELIPVEELFSEEDFLL